MRIYTIKMVPPEDSPLYLHNTMYLVANIGDSLYYRTIEDARPRRKSTTLSVRSLRALDVPDATTHYIWFEYAKSGRYKDADTVTTWEQWHAHVFSYDRHRGMRHLKGVPIRYEKRRNGTLHGVRQLDVSIPDVGLMKVEERLQRGAKITRGMNWHRHLGKHGIGPPPLEENDDASP